MEEKINEGDQLTPSTLHLLKISENGDIIKLKKYFKQIENPSIISIDLAIRKCLSRFDNSKKYYQTINELFLHADLNYANPAFDDSTILMKICEKTDITLLNNLLYHENDNENNKSNEEIDIIKIDKNNCNALHYLFLNSMCEDYSLIEFFKALFDYKTFKQKEKEIFLLQPNNDGITPLVIILQKGWYKMLSIFFKYIDYQKYIIPTNNNNLIHCAIDGKNIKCVKKILSFCKTDEELKHKNKEGYSPALYAHKKKLYLMEKLIDEIKNTNNNLYKNNLLSDKIVDVYQIIDLLTENNKNEYETNNLILSYLNQYKLYQSIFGNDYSNLSCEWNILYMKNQSLLFLNEKNIKKFNMFSCLVDFRNFFKKNVDIIEIKNNLNEINYSFDIIIYNMIIYYYVIGSYSSMIKVINLYFKYIYPEYNKEIKLDYEKNYFKFITYVNISFLLIEYLIINNEENISNLISEKLDNYLISSFRKGSCLYQENSIVIKYLNLSEVFNPFNPTWDDSYCYLNLLKALYFIKFKQYKEIDEVNNDKEKKIDENFIIAKKYLKEFKKMYNNCNYKEELMNFNRLMGFYAINKCYYYYLTNNIEKSFIKLSLIKQSLYKSNEHKLFYHNSLGILYLKEKKYNLSEYYFKLGINYFKSLNNITYMKESKANEDLLYYKFDYFIKMKYNLSLALFYNKKYREAYTNLKQISTVNFIKNNPFFWYRYGLVSLNLYLFNLRAKYFEFSQKRENIKLKEKIKDTSEYNNSISWNHNDENDSLSEINELYIEFEKEYGNNGTEYNEKCRQNNNKISNKINNKSNNIYHRLFLDFDIYRKMINKYKSDKISKYEKVEKFLLNSIYCFKKILILCKTNRYSIYKTKKSTDDIKDIIHFYINDKETSTKFYKNILENNLHKDIIPKSLLYSCLLNLLFCLALSQKFTEILLSIKFIKSIIRNLITVPDNIKRKINCFKLYALINLNKLNEAKKLITEERIKNDGNNINMDFFDNINTEKNIKYNDYLECGEILINCKKSNFSSTEGDIKNLINNNYDKTGNVSKFYQNLMNYILLLQNKTSKTANFIKYGYSQINNINNKTNEINNIEEDSNG